MNHEIVLPDEGEQKMATEPLLTDGKAGRESRKSIRYRVAPVVKAGEIGEENLLDQQKSSMLVHDNPTSDVIFQNTSADTVHKSVEHNSNAVTSKPFTDPPNGSGRGSSTDSDQPIGVSVLAREAHRTPQFINALRVQNGFPFGLDNPRQYTRQDIKRICRFLERQTQGHKTSEAVAMVETEDGKFGQQIIEKSYEMISNPTQDAKDAVASVILSLPGFTDAEKDVLRARFGGGSLEACRIAASLGSVQEVRAILNRARSKLGRVMEIVIETAVIPD